MRGLCGLEDACSLEGLVSDPAFELVSESVGVLSKLPLPCKLVTKQFVSCIYFTKRTRRNRVRTIINIITFRIKTKEKKDANLSLNGILKFILTLRTSTKLLTMIDT